MRNEIAHLEMGEFTEEEIVRVEMAMASIDLDQPATFTSFGSLESSGQSMDEITAMLEESPVTRLSAKLAEVVARLQDADPRVITKKTTFFQRALGAAVETRVKYQAARKGIDTLLDEAERLSGTVRNALAKVEGLINRHNEEMSILRVHIAAGRIYLARHPEAGKPVSEELKFEDNRERFSRRLANLAAMESAHQMSEVQLRLTRAQGYDILDRFAELSQFLIPMWRQHTLSLMNTTREDPELIAAANKAHDALIAGLASSMKGLQKQV